MLISWDRASFYGHPAVVDALIEAGANVKVGAGKDHIDNVHAHLAAGADPRFAVAAARPVDAALPSMPPKKGTTPPSSPCLRVESPSSLP